MKKILLLLGVPVGVVSIFISGSLPYTLVYDEESLRALEYQGKDPVSAEVVKCEVQNTDNLAMGDILETSFRVRLDNYTNRYVAISAIGEVFSPRGSFSGMHSQLMILSPNAGEETSFRSSTPFLGAGNYRCEVRYAIGRFES